VLIFQDCAKLIHHLLDCLSIALKLSSSDSLSSYHAKSLFNLDLLHYPPVSTQLLRSGAISRIPAHSDFGTLTLLFQDNTGGLEIADLQSASTEKSAEFEKHGKFRHVKPVPDTVIVNVGYLLMRWSNGRWRNTIHRVVEPPLQLQGMALNDSEQTKKSEVDARVPDETSPARYSIPFFSVPDPETIVQALPGCWTEEIPKKWRPISAGDYLRRKRENVYT
jgi:isopenicillin N synthase-like dioxygenase